METEAQFVCTLKLKDDGRKTGATYNTVSFSDCVSYCVRASKSKHKDFLLTHYFWGTIKKKNREITVVGEIYLFRKSSQFIYKHN